MKKSLLYGLLVGLTLGLSCKPKSADEPVPDLSRCRIVKETDKTTTVQQGSSENVKVESKTYKVWVSRVTTCIYDDQGRLVTERVITSRGDTGLIQYRYALKYIVKSSQYKLSPPLTSSSELDTIHLNEQGYISRSLDLKYQYNEQGYRVRSYYTDDDVLYRYQIANGNLIKSVFTSNYSAINQQTINYIYDSSRSNLPNRYPFLGRTSRNLVELRSETIDKSFDYIGSLAFETKYYYTYDADGRVKRQIAFGRSINPPFPPWADPEALDIIDFEYACN